VKLFTFIPAYIGDKVQKERNMKVLFLLLVICAVVSAYFSVNNNEESAVDLKVNAATLTLFRDKEKVISTTQYEVGSLSDNKAIKHRLDIDGFFDTTSIGLKEESIKHFQDDDMILVVSKIPSRQAIDDMMSWDGQSTMHSETTVGLMIPGFNSEDNSQP
jgi:hypothetical protein